MDPSADIKQLACAGLVALVGTSPEQLEHNLPQVRD